MDYICRVLKAWGSEVWVSCLNLSKSLTGGKAARKCRIRVRGILGQAVRFTGSEAVATNVEKSVGRRVVSQIRCEATRERVVKDTDAAAYDHVVGDAERLPGKTEPRRPDEAVRVRESLFLMSQYPTIVRLARVMADGIEWPSKSAEATIFTNWIGLVIGAHSPRQR